MDHPERPRPARQPPSTPDTCSRAAGPATGTTSPCRRFSGCGHPSRPRRDRGPAYARSRPEHRRRARHQPRRRRPVPGTPPPSAATRTGPGSGAATAAAPMLGPSGVVIALRAGGGRGGNRHCPRSSGGPFPRPDRQVVLRWQPEWS
jgi:hypothetical protein